MLLSLYCYIVSIFGYKWCKQIRENLINDDAKKLMQKIYTKSKYVAKRKDAKKKTCSITATLGSGANAKKNGKKTCNITTTPNIWGANVSFHVAFNTVSPSSGVVLGMKNEMGVK